MIKFLARPRRMVDSKLLNQHCQEVLQRGPQPRTADGEVDVRDLGSLLGASPLLDRPSSAATAIAGHHEGPGITMRVNMKV